MQAFRIIQPGVCFQSRGLWEDSQNFYKKKRDSPLFLSISDFTFSVLTILEYEFGL